MKSLAPESGSCGVLYFAIGARYAHEAEQSAASIRRFMPDLPITIICDHTVDPKLFDNILEPPAGIPLKRHKMAALKSSPYERTLYLDTDTVLLSPVWEIFRLLDTFDIAMTLAPGHTVSIDSDLASDLERDDPPQCYPTWNGGVIVYRKGPAWTDFIEEWDRLYQSMGRMPDQTSLRVAAFRSEAKIAPMPNSYNYRLNYPGALRGAVKILHGREPDIGIMRRKVNRVMKMRATLPPRYARSMIVYGDVRLVGVVRKRLRNFWWNHLSPRRNRKSKAMT